MGGKAFWFEEHNADICGQPAQSSGKKPSRTSALEEPTKRSAVRFQRQNLSLFAHAESSVSDSAAC